MVSFCGFMVLLMNNSYKVLANEVKFLEHWAALVVIPVILLTYLSFKWFFIIDVLKFIITLIIFGYC